MEVFTQISIGIIFLLSDVSAEIKLQYNLNEEIDLGSFVGNLKHDSQVVDNYTQSVLEVLRFGLLSGEHQGLFRVDQFTGIMYVKDRLDRDSLCSRRLQQCLLSIEAAIVEPREHFTVIHLGITIHDINDNAPTFGRDDFTLMLPESASPKSEFILPTASDPDSGKNSIQSYHMMTEHPLFSLSKGSINSRLSLVLEDHVDHESLNVYVLQVVAQDGGIPVRSATLTVHINVIDTNDNGPIFDKDLYEVSIHENTELFSTILQIRATDRDEGQNGEIIYSFTTQTLNEYGAYLDINNHTGEIYLTHHLDYQMGSMHELNIIAQDLGINSLQAHTTVIISLLDVNNHAPEITITSVISGQQIGLFENSVAGEFIALVTVKDLDPGQNGICICKISDMNFQLESLYTNGFKIISRRMFDREIQDIYQTVIHCHDSGTPSLNSRKEVEIEIHDVNDNAPEFSNTEYVWSILENSTIGTSVLTVTASDADEKESARVTYQLEESATQYLHIDPTTGLVTVAGLIDHEHVSILQYEILAQDHGSPPKTTKAILRVLVGDINDEAPIFIQETYNFGTYENQDNITEIGTVTAVDRDSEPNNLFAYSLYSTDTSTNTFDKFSIDSNSGRISSRVSLDREKCGVYHMIVMATNVEPPQLSSSVSVTIYVADKNDHKPIITFPAGENHSVEVSIFSPIDYVFSQVTALDYDLGKNAKLTFKLTYDYEFFAIDPLQGHLTVKSNLQKMTETSVDMYIFVTDEGSPPLASSATLQVLINKTKAFAEEQSFLPLVKKTGHSIALSEHEQILIILGAVTIVIVTILIAAIVLVKKRQLLNNHRTKETFHCMQRVEYSQKMATLSANTENSRENTPGTKDKAGSDDWHEDVNINNKLSFRNIKEGTLNKNCTGMEEQFDLDPEISSNYSAELSNIDSGHGLSEEGDAQNHATFSCPLHGSDFTQISSSKLMSMGELPSRHGPQSHFMLVGYDQTKKQNCQPIHNNQSPKYDFSTSESLESEPPPLPPRATVKFCTSVSPLGDFCGPPTCMKFMNGFDSYTRTGTGLGQRLHPQHGIVTTGTSSDNKRLESDDDSSSSGSFFIEIEQISSIDV